MALVERASEPDLLANLTIDAVRKLRLGPYQWRAQMGAVPKPAYGYCLAVASMLARRLEIPRISVVELGVAGGNGLVTLEAHARELTAATGTEFEIYGFDSGVGLPPPTDYRDLPYFWQPGYYEMDVEALSRRLRSAKLVLGDLEETQASFAERYRPAPIGAIMYDLDFYSSTVSGLKLLEVPPEHRLPRIYTYFDDIIGGPITCHSDFTGERLAIEEFNASHEWQKISPAYHLAGREAGQWQRRIFVAHDFHHPRYNDFVSDLPGQLPLRR